MKNNGIWGDPACEDVEPSEELVANEIRLMVNEDQNLFFWKPLAQRLDDPLFELADFYTAYLDVVYNMQWPRESARKKSLIAEELFRAIDDVIHPALYDQAVERLKEVD